MATILDLNTSITDMPREAAMQLILDLRKSRLTPKKARKVVKAPAKPKKKKDPLKSLAREELIKLLEESLK